MKKIRIGYFADGKWSHLAFEKLINEASIEIAFIVPRSDTKDETLKNYAKKYSIDYLKSVNVNSDEFYEKAKSYRCDLHISMSFNQIFRERIINLPPLKTINCHAGKLPFYRGRNILNWALINDEKEFGITIHYVDTGIDTGDILSQSVFEITDKDDYETLLNTAHVECANCLFETIKGIQDGGIKVTKQKDIHPVGFYCSGRTIGDELLDWNQTSREVFNFVRAICKPGPCAQSFIDEKRIKINRVELIEQAPVYKNTTGQVIGKEGETFIVKTKDSFVKVTEYEFDGRVKVGDRLKLN
jgi:methionyl-tRNA formyltransferase